MKFLLLPLLLAGAGAGWYGLAPRAADATPEACVSKNCPLGDCRVTVECTDHGTCLITCYEASGEIRCQKEVDCDGPCDKACDKPCDKMAKAAGKTCTPGSACAR